jgi:predicted alpha/beta-hydrolase family hydrolase
VTSSNDPEAFSVALPSGGTVTALHYAAAPAAAAVVLAHGAGAGQLSTFMTQTARAFARAGFDAITFNFPYIEQKRRVPDRAPVLEACYTAVVRDVRERVPSAARALFIGGKSMGGRMATHIAAADRALAVDGLVLFGYPLHPPGKPDRRRDAHLPSIASPVLVVQGSRDPFGTPDELRPGLASIPGPVTLHVVDGGDHSFKVTPGGRARQAAVDEEIVRISEEWMRAVLRRKDGGC